MFFLESYDNPVDHTRMMRAKECLKKERYDEFEQRVLAEAPLRQDIWLYKMVEELQYDSDVFTRYCARVPGSWMAHSLYADSMIKEAWRVRGTDFASNTSKEKLQKHAEMCDEAFGQAHMAYQLGGHAHSACLLFVCFKVLTRDLEPLLGIFSDCIERYPEHQVLVTGLLDAMAPKWSGIPEAEWRHYEEQLRTQFEPVMPHYGLVNNMVRDVHIWDFHNKAETVYELEYDDIVRDYERILEASHLPTPFRDMALNRMAEQFYCAGDSRMALRAIEAANGQIFKDAWSDHHYFTKTGVKHMLDPPRWKLWAVRAP